ncbi:hypothetical protein FSU_2271 [Fibrobacter succinogenes subsp. succinogenes S85]|uniref:Uncharacterized protein n=1 Tax=Fibrobacter succinogenes (strain ATCC 19169 / S85) TaxID=59374 RepID=D9S439_FIBSS|nr:hypothetical protein FSU_2271 [Fibrobacter succinogenes subsp. succinogenes S85]
MGPLFFLNYRELTTNFTSSIKYCSEEYLNTGNLLKLLFSSDAANFLRYSVKLVTIVIKFLLSSTHSLLSMVH